MDSPLDNFYTFYTNNKNTMAEDEALAATIKKDLKAKLKDIKEFFDEYDPMSIEHMLYNYGHIRLRYTKNAKYYADRAEEMTMEYRKEAEKCLLLIQHKKLFNLQCLWRAGRIELEGIETTYDFYKWTQDLYHCPFLSEIAESEVDLMIRFMEETPAELAEPENFFGYDWHNYPYLKTCYCEREEIELEEFYLTYFCAIMDDNGIPPWYDFYDNFMGTTGLLALPDVKMPKESYYQQIYLKHKAEEKSKEAEQASIPPAPEPEMPERLPWMGTDYDTDEAIAEMVEEFETPENQKLYENYVIVEQLSNDDQILKEEMQNVLYKLEEAREPVPIEAHEDWRQAVIIAYRKFKAKKTIEAIPAAYQYYLMRIQTGLGFPTPEELGEPDYFWKTPAYLIESKQEILEGRKLLGEPMDFNY